MLAKPLIYPVDGTLQPLNSWGSCVISTHSRIIYFEIIYIRLCITYCTCLVLHNMFFPLQLILWFLCSSVWFTFCVNIDSVCKVFGSLFSCISWLKS